MLTPLTWNQVTGEVSVDRERFREALVARRFCEPHDLRDVSLVPLVIDRGRQAWFERTATRVCRAALAAFVERRDPTRFAGDSYQALLQSLPLRQRLVSGNARLDFLEEGDRAWLVEANFMNVGTVGRPHQAAVAVLECCPAAHRDLQCLLPTDAFRRQLERLGMRTVALLTKNDDRECGTPWLDRGIISDAVQPVELVLVPRHDWSSFSTAGGLSRAGRRFDAIYPRELDERPLLETHAGWARWFLDSGVPCLDHWSLMLLEDKDLRFLATHDSGLAELLPATWRLAELPSGQPLDEIVLKRRHDHGGAGVTVAPARLPPADDGELVAQARISMNRMPVRTLLGREGTAFYDLAVHVCYDYDVVERRLVHCEVSGYLSRFSLTDPVVNISRGGGVIPVLLERAGP